VRILVPEEADPEPCKARRFGTPTEIPEYNGPWERRPLAKPYTTIRAHFARFRNACSHLGKKCAVTAGCIQHTDRATGPLSRRITPT